MKSFRYLIHADFAMHFGPAGRLAELARVYPDTTAIVEMGTRRANISRPMKVATLGIRKGDRVCRWSIRNGTDRCAVSVL